MITDSLKPLLFSVVLCGAFLVPAAAQDAPAAPTTQAAPASHQYLFEPISTPAPGGGTTVYVRLSDSQDEEFHKRVLYILDDAGQFKRADRAKIIADRLNEAVKDDPDFVDNILPPASVGTEVVLKLKNQGTGWIITADEGSMRAANASTRQEYAERIIANIKDRLKGIKLRDAAFDYDLKGEQKKVRAFEYFDQAQDAYEDKDTDVALNKYQIALKLQPDYNFCRLRLADLYAELGQKSNARKEYQMVKENDSNAADKQVASDKLNSLGAG